MDKQKYLSFLISLFLATVVIVAQTSLRLSSTSLEYSSVEKELEESIMTVQFRSDYSGPGMAGSVPSNSFADFTLQLISRAVGRSGRTSGKQSSQSLPILYCCLRLDLS